MKVVRKSVAGRGITLGTADIPQIGENDVLIKVKKVGICGTDFHVFKWDQWSQNRIKPPLIMGHEFVGEIAQLGSNVKGFCIGQRVSAEGHITCGFCKFCRTGEGHICATVNIIGVDIDGCFAEYISMPAYNVWPVSDEIEDKYAATFDPLGNAMHTVMRQSVAMKTVLITGAGAIGLFAIPIAKSVGASKVIVVEPNETKMKLAKQVGADYVFDPRDSDIKEKIMSATGGRGCDVLLEMSGVESSIHLGLNVLTFGGVVSMLGIPSGNTTLNLPEMVIFKGATLHGITGRRMFETWYQCDEFLRTKSALIDPIITHTIDMDDIEQGFLLMESGEGVKVLVDIK